MRLVRFILLALELLGGRNVCPECGRDASEPCIGCRQDGACGCGGSCGR